MIVQNEHSIFFPKYKEGQVKVVEICKLRESKTSKL